MFKLVKKMELDIISHQPPPFSDDIQFSNIKEDKMQTKLKPLQEIPDELVAEVSTLYDMGLESYEVDYILSLRTKEY